jgi:hypothetical protein
MLLNSFFNSVAHSTALTVVSTRRHIVLSVVPVLIGCSLHPLPDDVTRTATDAIVQQVRCEAKAAVLDFGARLGNAGVAYEFEFNITENNSESGNLGLTHPFSNGTFSLNVNAGSIRNRNAVRNFKLQDSFDELRKADCSSETLQKNWIYPLVGNVGMYEAVGTFVRLQKIENPGAGELFIFADHLAFTTTFDGGMTAKLTLTPVSNRFRIADASASLGASRIDIHKVTVTMSAGPAAVVTRISRAGRLIEGRRATRAVAGAGALPGNSLLSTTLVQQGSSAKDQALYELDRQRELEFRRNATILLGAP